MAPTSRPFTYTGLPLIPAAMPPVRAISGPDARMRIKSPAGPAPGTMSRIWTSNDSTFVPAITVRATPRMPGRTSATGIHAGAAATGKRGAVSVTASRARMVSRRIVLPIKEMPKTPSQPLSPDDDGNALRSLNDPLGSLRLPCLHIEPREILLRRRESKRHDPYQQIRIPAELGEQPQGIIER